MKKYIKFVTIVSLVFVSGSAFAKTGPVNYALENAISNTDAQVAPSANAALQQYQAADVPAPSMARAGVQLQDITDKCTQDGDVVSAFPRVYTMLQKEENSRVIKVFGFTDSKGIERRVEIFFTGGDWMQYGLTFVATNAGLEKNQVKAYFVNDLSTPDHEDGAVAPKVDPFNAAKLAEFLATEFLGADGSVKAAYGSAAAATASAD